MNVLCTDTAQAPSAAEPGQICLVAQQRLVGTGVVLLQCHVHCEGGIALDAREPITFWVLFQQRLLVLPLSYPVLGVWHKLQVRCGYGFDELT